MILGLKKFEIDCKNYKIIVYLFIFDIIFFLKFKVWLYNIVL